MSYEYPPIGGGGARVAHPLAVALSKRGHNVQVVTSGMKDLPMKQDLDGITVHRVRCRRKHIHFTTTGELLTCLWPMYRKACELIEHGHCDVNHTHFALPTGLVSYLLYRTTGLPYIITVHGSDVPGYNPDRFRLAHIFIRPIWKKILRSSSRIVSPSRYLADLIKSQLDVRVDTVPNGYSTTPVAISRTRKNRILVVTRMFPRKGVQHFIKALAGFDHDWEVVIAGDGPYLPALKALASSLGVDVRFAGFLHGDELNDLYQSAKIFVFPSTMENFPTVLLEAMNAGCAIITTNAGGSAEVIGDAGIVLEPGQPGRIREALQSIMDDEARLSVFSARAKARIAQFAWPEIATNYENALIDALDK